MLKQTLRYIAREWIALGAITAFFACLPYLAKLALGPDTFIGVIRAIGWLIVTYYVQRSLLHNVRFAQGVKGGLGNAKGLIAFMAKAFVLFAVSFLPSLALMIYSAETLDADTDLLVGKIAGVLLWYVSAAFVFSLAGTWLPATVDRRASSLREALARGKSSFIPMLWRYLVFLTIPGTLLLWGVAVSFAYLAPDDNLAMNLVLYLLGSALQAYLQVFLSVALVSAYKDYQPARAGVLPQDSAEAS